MPPKLRLETARSLEVSVARLSPRYGCGLMLKKLPGFDGSDAMLNIMENYGYKTLAADKPARKIITNPGLLKPFYENAFSHKVKLPRNFLQSFDKPDLYLAYDPKARTAWFISEPQNRMALVNYFRDAVSLGLKPFGVMLTGATVRLTPVGWQNLHDLLSDEMLEQNPPVKRVEVMSLLAGVRWREPHLGIGVTFLNFSEAVHIGRVTQSALRGEQGEDIVN